MQTDALSHAPARAQASKSHQTRLAQTEHSSAPSPGKLNMSYCNATKLGSEYGKERATGRAGMNRAATDLHELEHIRSMGLRHLSAESQFRGRNAPD